MKKTSLFISFISLISVIASLGLQSCGNEEPIANAQPGNDDNTCSVSISVGVSSFQLIEDYTSRATAPMGPEVENCIRTLTVLQFDKEGNMRQVPSDGKYYRFSTWTNVLYPQGVMSLNLTYTDFYEGESTVCLIANIEEEEVKNLIYRNGNTSDPINLSEFKKLNVMMDYVMPNAAGNNGAEAGHMREIYMFGYYEGMMTANQQLNIAMARLVSRIDVAFSLADGANWDSNKHIYMTTQNLERNVHLWPASESQHNFWPATAPALYPLDFSTTTEQNHIIYFYAGPNSAKNPEQATQLLLWYRDEANAPTSADNPDATIYLCNSPLNENAAERNYQLNRNSFYRFNLTLTNKK